MCQILIKLYSSIVTITLTIERFVLMKSEWFQSSVSCLISSLQCFQLFKIIFFKKFNQRSISNTHQNHFKTARQYGSREISITGIDTGANWSEIIRPWQRRTCRIHDIGWPPFAEKKNATQTVKRSLALSANCAILGVTLTMTTPGANSSRTLCA